MKINQKITDGLLTISIDGDLDASTAMDVDYVIKEAYTSKNYKILVDCKQLQYISSAGLGVFISYMEEFEQNKGSFVFFDMNEQVYSVFELLGLHQIFSIVENELEAKKRLKNN